MMMVVALAVAALGAPVSLVPGVVVAGGQAVRVDEFGVTMTIPAGYSGQLAGDWLLLGNGSVTLAVTAEDGVTVADVASLLGAPLSLDLVTHLLPADAPTVTGDQVAVRYTVALAPRKAAHARATVSSGGVGVAVLAIGPADQPLDAVADSALRGVTFARPAAAPAPEVSAGPTATGPWAQRLAGRRLAFRHLANGFRSEWSVDFCSDGSFLYKTSSYSGGNTSLSSSGRYTGRWSTDGERVHLRYEDGSTEQGVLRDGDGVVYWGDSKTTLENNPTCG